MRRKSKVLSILAAIIFLSAAVIGIFKQEKVLKAGILTKGRILYKSSGMKKEDEEKQAKEKAGTQIEEGTVLEDATEGKVLVNYEYWDKDGKKHTGKYYAVLPGNVKSGVKYGAYGTEYTGTMSGIAVLDNDFL